MNVSLVLAICCFVVFYLIQSNNLVGCSYEIREQKERIAVLEAENYDLEAQITQWRSPSNLENLVQELEMVEVGEVIYLKSEKAVAIKD